MDPLTDPPLDLELTVMLEKPHFLVDPVFPKDSYLQAVASSVFPQVLTEMDAAALIKSIRGSQSSPQMAMLMAQSVGCWAIDLDEISRHGVTGRDEFISRVREPIRRPPPALAALAAEQHLVKRGVVQIQIDDGPSVPGQYQLCTLKTVGWYVATIVPPKG